MDGEVENGYLSVSFIWTKKKKKLFNLVKSKNKINDSVIRLTED